MIEVKNLVTQVRKFRTEVICANTEVRNLMKEVNFVTELRNAKIELRI